MIDFILSALAPHHCSSCGSEGDILCASCSDFIADTVNEVCIICKSPTSDVALCKPCCRKSYLDGAWVVGRYEGVLKRIISDYKFEGKIAAHIPLASLLAEAIPYLFTTTNVVNIPTSPKHIRQRGYDHTKLIAQSFAKTSQLPYRQLLIRKNNSRQLGASKSQREQQAKCLFEVCVPVDPHVPILLIDDVVTAGSTLNYAAQALKQAGVHRVFAAVCSYETWRT